jgi:hypothetical protein
MPAAHTDFARAFTPGTMFRDSKGNEYPIRLLDAGDLVLPTGRIVACDPGYLRRAGLDECQPYTRVVPPGRYPVTVCLRTRYYADRPDERVAAAMIRFTDTEPVVWEMALLPGQDPAALLRDQFFGYGVDGGTGCFADARLVESLAPEQVAWSERIQQPWPPGAGWDYGLKLDPPLNRALWDGFFGNVQAGRVYAVNVPGPDGETNLIAFCSGEGDGSYASYWGLDAAGNPCRLATCFGLLLESFDETLSFRFGTGERVFHHPGLTAARGVNTVVVETEVEDPPPRGWPGERLDYKLTVGVALEGPGYVFETPKLRGNGREYRIRWSGGTQSGGHYYAYYLDEPIPEDAEVLVTYTARTVPL